MGGIFSRIPVPSVFQSKEPQTPIQGVAPRIKNILTKHFRGIFGVLIPIIILSWQLQIKDHQKTVIHMWIWMFCSFLIQPISVQITGTIPLFALPMLGIQATKDAVAGYFNEGIALFVVGGMLNVLLNNSGFDKRVMLSLLCKGSNSAIMVLLKSSLAGFILSMFSNRLIVASTLIQYVTPTLSDLGKGGDSKQIRYIVNNGIQTSCSIGGIAIIHASYCTLAFRSIFNGSLGKKKEYADTLNYLQYTAFAFPVALVMFIVNFIAHAIMLKVFGDNLSDEQQAKVATNLSNLKSKIPPKITNHELWTLLFAVISLAMFFGRWNQWTKSGWAGFSVGQGETVPKVKDATVAALFVIALHIIPRSYGFVKILTAKTKKDLPPVKAESAILFWRFVDKNTNYGYFLLIGAGLALCDAAMRPTDKDAAAPAVIINNKFSFLTNQDFNVALLLICFVTVILCNMITGVAAVVIWLPLILCLKHEKATDNIWYTSIYRGALGVGIGSSFGFISPFLYTPAYFCHHNGKVPKLIMLKYSIVPCILMAVILWVALAYFAPVIFSDSILEVDKPTTLTPYGVETTTGSPGDAAPPPP